MLGIDRNIWLVITSLDITRNSLNRTDQGGKLVKNPYLGQIFKTRSTFKLVCLMGFILKLSNHYLIGFSHFIPLRNNELYIVY